MNKKMFRCRLQKVTIDGLKNVGHGEIRFSCNMCDDIFGTQSDILGIYGQNGSGKTTLIFAMEVLKQLLSGRRLWKDMDRFVRIGERSSKIEYDFSLESETYGRFLVRYFVEIKRKNKEDVIPDMEAMNEENDLAEFPVFVSREILQYKCVNGEKGNRYSSIIEYSYEEGSENVFGPDVRYKDFISKDKTLADELRYLKNAVYKIGSSFIFSAARVKNIRERQGFSDELVYILDSVQLFGVAKLFVLSNVQASVVNANIVLPMSFCSIDEKNKSFKYIVVRIKLTDETDVPQDIYDMIQKRFMVIGGVIAEIIPNMSLKVANRGIRTDEKGERSVIIELLSVRGEKEVPLRYESDGIKKLIYVLYSLIEMYNDDSVTVAIDELDSGVFEYLLGEILSVLQENAKGQLMFTSHNLRPLEVLDKRNVMFSTTNEDNRYIRFKNVKGSNNLRDVYYQDILLGGQDECVYEPTSQSAIRRAFRKAGGDLNG
ncbi:MAG: ATP-binding protein [Eubacterium sp.]|nr:ATP-binding protein [Eubacterium sp.]MCM1213852.1 ATP-binding protein [Lachnospiraceae bacterium]MCM1237971.1 ATP-binding protein [Lachnospiraceae bacterium]